MKKSLRFFSTIVVAMVFMFSAKLSLADHVLSCPSALDLSVAKHEVSLPYGYDDIQQLMQVFSIGTLGNNAVVLGYPLSVGAADRVEVRFSRALGRLRLVTETPFYIQVDDVSVAVCAYKSLEFSDMTVMVYRLDGYEETSSRSSNHQKKLMRHIRSLLGFAVR